MVVACKNERKYTGKVLKFMPSALVNVQACLSFRPFKGIGDSGQKYTIISQQTSYTLAGTDI